MKELYLRALRYVIECGYATIYIVVKRFNIRFLTAGEIFAWMESMGYISEPEGTTTRQVLLTLPEFIEKYGDIQVEGPVGEPVPNLIRSIIETRKTSAELSGRSYEMEEEFMEYSAYADRIDAINAEQAEYERTHQFEDDGMETDGFEVGSADLDGKDADGEKDELDEKAEKIDDEKVADEAADAEPAEQEEPVAAEPEEKNYENSKQLYIDALKYAVSMAEVNVGALCDRFALTETESENIIDWMFINEYVGDADNAGFRKVTLSNKEFKKKFPDN